MIVHEDIIQGSPEWLALRMGRPTASEFHRVLTPARGQIAEGRWEYAYQLAVEILLNESKDSIEHVEWVERGKMLEPQAVQQYEFVNDVTTRAVGFVTTDDGRWGCSPDRLIIERPAGLEIKSPSAPVHLRYLHEGPGSMYRCQIQGSLLITGLEQWELYSFHPALPQVRHVFDRDEPFISKLRAALEQFSDELAAIVEKVRAAGFVAPRERTYTPTDAAYRELVGDHPGLWAV